MLGELSDFGMNFSNEWDVRLKILQKDLHRQPGSNTGNPTQNGPHLFKYPDRIASTHVENLP